jgi:F0F1-type ATP synthase delta subunit
MKKLTTFSIDLILATNMYGIPLFDNLLSSITLSTDSQGNVLDTVVDNIKTTLKVAIIHLQKKGEEAYVPKIKSGLKSLLEYGTVACTIRMQEFLDSIEESKSSIVLNSIEEDYLHLCGEFNFSKDKLPTMQSVINGIRQID